MMNDQDNLNAPVGLEIILSETAHIGFNMVSEPLTGSLLRSLAASKPHSNFLEIGTGTGVSTAWLLDGMDNQSHLVSVENDENAVSIAQRYLGHDQRVSFVVQDAGDFLEQNTQQFDFIFADAWPGKYTHLEEALHSLKPSGLYIIDDMLPQPNWPEGHAPKVAQLVQRLESEPSLLITKLNWASGIIIAIKQAA
jgi:predicted O-methyltransferase YrrM